jgi:hypothetical protein
MNRTEARIFRIALACALVHSFAPATGAAQSAPFTEGSLRHEMFVQSPGESYLRYLQTLGKVPGHPWTRRGFSERELRSLIPKDSAHPWADRYVDDSRTVYGIRYGFIEPNISARYNSGFAYGSNDGPIWAGRGLTSAVQAGFYAQYGPVTLTLAPLAFRAENQAFDMAPTAQGGNPPFGNPDFAGIDRPQRFGNAAYSQLDPGQSTLRVDLPFVTAGVSTANQTWGPAQDYPILLGNNAAGFPHAFAGTSEPVNLGIAKIHGQVFWGELFQSAYSPVQGPAEYVSKAEPGTKRFATGLIVIAQPWGLNGLEVGGGRFFHSIWPTSGIPRSYFTKVFQGLLKKDVKPDRVADPRFPGGVSEVGISDNQLVSVFARWVLPHSGFELHAEYGREDHSYDFRDLVQEPDHSRSYSIGARKVFNFSPEKLTAGRFEILNFQLPQLSRYRGEGEMYVHGLIRQGHTYRGQLLGADAGVGTGAGSVLAVDQFTPAGKWTASWTRIVRREDGNFTLLGIRSPRSIDVSHALGFENTRTLRDFELTSGLTIVREFNRDFRHDATNVNALVSVRYLIH